MMPLMRRQRLSEDSNDCSRSASPESSPSTVGLQEELLRDREDQGSCSPRAVVAGRLGELTIRGDFLQISDHSLHQTAILPLFQSSCFPNFSTNVLTPHDMPDLQSSAAIKRHSRSPDDQIASSSSAADVESQPQIAESPVNTARKLSTSPQKKRNPPVSSKARGARGSSPLAGDVLEDLLTWNDSEITGHNPTDPDDDGYGINGIGFKPTAAIAWARSQKRQKQVAEWKNREAREARERRRGRRDGNNDLDKLRTVQQGAIQKKVKFDV